MMIAPAFIIGHPDDQVRRFLVFALISFGCHVLLFCMVAFVHFPSSVERRIVPPESIDVDLLAFNAETPLPPARTAVQEPAAAPGSTAASAPAAPAAPEPAAVPVKKGLQKKRDLSDAVVAKPQKQKKIVKKPAARKEIDSEQVLQDAVKRIEAQAAAAQTQSVADRIENLKKEVRIQTGKPAASQLPAARSGNAYPRDFSQIEVFQAEVSVRLKNNWVFSEKLAGETKGLESRLVIKVLPDGTITDVWFEKRSGNEYLDNSAYKTVMKSNPLPPLPSGFAYYHLVLGFTPSGLSH